MSLGVGIGGAAARAASSGRAWSTHLGLRSSSRPHSSSSRVRLSLRGGCCALVLLALSLQLLAQAQRGGGRRSLPLRRRQRHLTRGSRL